MEKKSLWNTTWKVEYRPKRPTLFSYHKRNWQTWQSHVVYYWGPTKNHLCDWVPACNIIVIILTNILIITIIIIIIIIIIITTIINASYSPSSRSVLQVKHRVFFFRWDLWLKREALGSKQKRMILIQTNFWTVKLTDHSVRTNRELWSYVATERYNNNKN